VEAVPFKVIGDGKCIIGSFLRIVLTSHFARGPISSQVGERIRERSSIQIRMHRFPTRTIRKPVIEDDYSFLTRTDELMTQEHAFALLAFSSGPG
jgi:hypothetical protein